MLHKIGVILPSHSLRQIPIFDTNVFGDVQRGLISQTDWKCLLRHRPRLGWPISNVTALELLVGIHAVLAQDFLHVKERIALAYHLSNGRVLEDPRFLLCKELLHIPFPSDQLPPISRTISKLMDVIRRASSLEQLLSGGVPYKGRRAGLDTTSVLADVIAGPKRAWIAAVELMADEKYPPWASCFGKSIGDCPLRRGKNLSQGPRGRHSALYSSTPYLNG